MVSPEGMQERNRNLAIAHVQQAMRCLRESSRSEFVASLVPSTIASVLLVLFQRCLTLFPMYEASITTLHPDVHGCPKTFFTVLK